MGPALEAPGPIGALAIAAMGAVTWMAIPPEQKARLAAAGEDETSQSRLVRWQEGIDMANENPVLGIGYNNWESYYGPLSHNIFIQAWSEMGYLGLIAFLGLIGATFRVNFKTRKLMRGLPTPHRFLIHMAYGLDGVLIGYMASGFFVTVLYYPYFWIKLAMTVALPTAARNKRKEVAKAARRKRRRPAKPGRVRRPPSSPPTATTARDPFVSRS